MKKILAIILVTAMAIAMLPSISAPILVQIIDQPGAPIINDFCVPDYYFIGTFSLSPNQTSSFTIPATACPLVKQGPLGLLRGFTLPLGQLTDIGIDADTAVMDNNIQYNCYYQRPCDCIIPEDNQIGTNEVVQVGACFPRQLRVCANAPILAGCLSVRLYTNQGETQLPPSTSQVYDQEGTWCAYMTLASDITRIEIQNVSCEGSVQGEVSIGECCCYDCYKQKALPTTLYPKIDIETFSVSGGPTVIQNGKVISEFQMSPGSQLVLLQVENRGFFTQNDARIRFDGLPEGITVEVTPETQKLTAHNIGTYSANFTVGPNVPSGTYQITMIAYSPNGMFDKITFEFVVQ